MSIHAAAGPLRAGREGLQHHAAAARAAGLRRRGSARPSPAIRRPASSPLDLSATLGTDHAATTPFMLARYARIRRGERAGLHASPRAARCWAVLRGRGALRARRRDAALERRCDMLALPGGVASTWAAEEDAVLWLATDEPTLAFLGVRPEVGDRAPIEATHYRARRHRPRAAHALRAADDARDAGPRAVHGERAHREARHLPAGDDADAERGAPRRGSAPASPQRGRPGAGPARGALRIDDRRPDLSVDAARDAADAGRRRARPSQRAEDRTARCAKTTSPSSLIVQDGGLYYYGRTTWTGRGFGDFRGGRYRCPTRLFSCT